MQRRADTSLAHSLLAAVASTTLGTSVARVWSNDVATNTRGSRSDLCDSSRSSTSAANAARELVQSIQLGHASYQLGVPVSVFLPA